MFDPVWKRPESLKVFRRDYNIRLESANRRKHRERVGAVMRAGKGDCIRIQQEPVFKIYLPVLDKTAVDFVPDGKGYVYAGRGLGSTRARSSSAL